MTGMVAETVRIMGGERVLGRRVRVVDDLRRAVIDGLPVQALIELARHVGRPELKYRVVPKATLHRRRVKLSLEESERLERIARIVALAEHVWENQAHALTFLTNTQAQLGGETPLEMARTDLGAREVEELLWKIEYSLPV